MLHRFHYNGIPQVYNNCWVDPIATCKLWIKEKISCPCCESKHDSFAFHSVALTLYLTMH